MTETQPSKMLKTMLYRSLPTADTAKNSKLKHLKTPAASKKSTTKIGISNELFM